MIDWTINDQLHGFRKSPLMRLFLPPFSDKKRSTHVFGWMRVGGFSVFSLQRSALIIRALARSQSPSDSSRTTLTTIFVFFPSRWRVNAPHDLQNTQSGKRTYIAPIPNPKGLGSMASRLRAQPRNVRPVAELFSVPAHPIIMARRRDA